MAQTKLRAEQLPTAREVLTADRTYYVATTGSDSNDGLTSGTPFLTIQKAISTIGMIDISIYTVIIQLANGTYTSGVNIGSAWIGSGTVVLKGDTAIPSNVTISTTGNTIYVGNQGRLTIQGAKIASSGASGIVSFSNSDVTVSTGVEFGVCSFAHMYAVQAGIITNIGINYTISGDAIAHYLTESNGIIKFAGQTVTLSGTRAFAIFASASRMGLIETFGQTYSGTATGTRYNISGNSVCFTNSGGASYFPGSVAGSTVTGGQYI